jgi:hypothetical protein
VIFLGYSLTDENVQEIIASIAGVLTEANLSKLQDRLIFIQWSASPTQTVLAKSFLTREGFQIPIWSVEVSSFEDVFRALGRIKRKLPARVLRRVKEQVYELAFTGRSNGTIFVEDLEDEVHASDVDVVIGVGVHDRLAAHGLIGWDRTQLIDEVLDRSLSGRRDAMETLAVHALQKHLAGGTNTPIFYYLKNAGRLDETGKISSEKGLDARVIERAANIVTLLAPPPSAANAQRRRVGAYKTFAELAAKEDVQTALTLLLCMSPDQVNSVGLRKFLLDHRALVDGKPTTYWAKAVCYYDWLVYGRGIAKSVQPPPAPKRTLTAPKKTK